MPRSGPLDLKGICRHSAMRLPLDGVEAWRGVTFLGTISGAWLAAKVQEQLDHIEISEWLRAELAADPTRHLGPPDRPRMLAAPAGPITSATKARRRAARRQNKGRRRPRPPC
jgi:hypothetical protein